MASNEVEAIRNAGTAQDVAVAYDKYRERMEAEGQTPKALRDL